MYIDMSLDLDPLNPFADIVKKVCLTHFIDPHPFKVEVVADLLGKEWSIYVYKHNLAILTCGLVYTECMLQDREFMKTRMKENLAEFECIFKEFILSELKK